MVWCEDRHWNGLVHENTMLASEHMSSQWQPTNLPVLDASASASHHLRHSHHPSHQRRRTTSCPRNARTSNHICISFLFFYFFLFIPPEQILFSVYLPSTLPHSLRDMRIPIFPSNLPAYSTQDLSKAVINGLFRNSIIPSSFGTIEPTLTIHDPSSS